MAGNRDEAEAGWLDAVFDQLKALTDQAIAVVAAAEAPADMAEAEKRARAVGVLARTARAVAALKASPVRKSRNPEEDEMSEDDRDISDAELAGLQAEFYARVDHLVGVVERKSLTAGLGREPAARTPGDGVEGGAAEDLARARGARPAKFERVVVAVDPPASAHGDACGIVVAGRKDKVGYVLADRSARGLSPAGWAQRAAETAAEFGADLVLAEANQGGEMVRTLLAQADCEVLIKLVHASRSKKARAEPVAALYEQGRVVHCGAFPALEEEMMALGSEAAGAKSPDRADALVWALTHLLLAGKSLPRLRAL
ncbi:MULTISPECIES: phage terminase large subunit family protein [unclassified Brevundimonas]|uniref:phage terminase large subunit family protein n=1 Tax=unclassified Brevundimonas TaxID=2622653 RepID=UPI003F90787B